MIYKYDNTFKPEGHGQFIDASNNTLILYGGQHHDYTFQIFDLDTKQIKPIQHTNIIIECSYCPQSAFIQSPINQIHVMDYHCNHFIFDITNKQTTKVKK